MDFATLLGLLLAGAILFQSVAADGSLRAFVNVPALLLVVGGTLAAALLHQRLRPLGEAVAAARHVLFTRIPAASALTAQIQELAERARSAGVLALDGAAPADPLLARAVALAVEGAALDAIALTLRRELTARQSRHERAQSVFRFLANTAPAMGVIGTLIGLVAMLQRLDDPAALARGMALALLATLYGALLGVLVFGPLAEKLAARTREELVHGQLVITGIEAIVQTESARLTQAKLDAWIPPRERAPLAAPASASAPAAAAAAEPA